ncbi:MAG: M24 family metallopeptidase [Alphaproteobacteria bacterium]|nr:M24 family metallopeptidase [Alphaproteobacteria bacterium]
MTVSDAQRLAHLIAAEACALNLLHEIETAAIVAPGRLESAVEADIAAIAARDFGVTRNWHKRLVRAGPNSVCLFSDDPPDRVIAPNDTVYLDLGPVFGEWEADVGATYVVGDDPARRALVSALPEVFAAICAHARAHPDITGAELYEFAHEAAAARGFVFGGKIAGHTIGEFSHLTWPGERAHTRIWPDNPTRLSDPDHLGRTRFWIVETHLLAPDRSFGGFYERLLRP